MRNAMRGRCVSILLVLGVFGALPRAAFSQAVYGSIFGTATDPSGAAVPGAKVTITNLNKNTRFETTTNEAGNYSRTQLIPDPYQVEVEATGFRKAVVGDITVSADTAARVDVQLQVGDVAEQVEVTAEAPLLKSDRSDVATSFSSHQLNDLPSFGRNFQAYELLVPGTQKLGWQHASSENPQGSLQISVNGQHFSGTGFQLDGTDNQDPILGIIVINPTLESVTESKITTQNYDAEFGLAIAGVVTAQTKSGTNEIHGSAFEYLRNNSPGFQSFARNPFNAAENEEVPPVKWNQFGGSIGGPFKKNKLFAFGDAQLTRRRTGSSVLTQVPTLKARDGDFSEYLEPGRNAIYDPLSGDPNTGLGRQPFSDGGILNKIPSARLSQQALNLLNFIPNPNTVDPGGSPFRRNFAATGSENFDTNQWNTRIDYFVNDTTNMFGRYSWASFDKFAPGAFGLDAGGPALDNINFAGRSDVRNQSVAYGLNHTFSPTLLTEFRFGFMRYRVNVLPNDLGTSPMADAGIPGLNLDDFFTSGLSGIFINGDGGFNFGYSLGTNQCNCPLDQQEQQFQWVSNTTKIVGDHSIKFGADLRYAMNLRVPSDSHRAGELSFDNNFTGFVPELGAGVQQGLGLATFMLGETTFFRRYVSPFTDAAERQKRFFWYVQDTWRVTSKLMLNYGVRWEMVFPETVNGPGRGGQLDLRTGEIAVFGVGEVSGHGIQEMNWKNFAPRLGITYQLTPRTVIRAGYGWSYALGTFGTLFGHNVTQNLPVLAFQELTRPNDFSSVFSLADGPEAPTFPEPGHNGRFTLPNGVSGKSRPLDLKMPRVMAYNVTVQHQFTNTLSVEAGYVGNVGRDSFNGDGPNFNVNEPAFVPGVADTNLRRPFFAQYGWTQGIEHYCNCATTQYDSLQFKAEKRFARGFNIMGHYTYGRGEQDSGDSWTFLYNRPLGRGVNDYDITHIGVISGSWELPFGRGRAVGGQVNRLADTFIGGWVVNGVGTIYSGLPFTPSFDVPQGVAAIRPNAGPANRPDRGSGSPYPDDQNRDHWIVADPQLEGPFRLPPDNEFGDYGRNTLRGPTLSQVDFSIFKNFKTTETTQLQLRVEAFNVLNHTNLGLPNSNVTSGDAGRISGLAASGGDHALGVMRRLQFALRFQF